MPFSYPDVDPCPFCVYLSGAVAWEPVLLTGRVAAFVNNRQRSRGALLVAPRRHIQRLADLDADEVDETLRVVRAVSAAVTRAFQPDGLHVWCGGGVLAGQSEPHVHFQVMPRYADVEYTFATSHDLDLTDRAERVETATQLRAALAALMSGTPARS